MATFLENIHTIENAVYGKEMRPAIREALLQDWAQVKNMMSVVDKLNARLDAMSGDEPEPDTPDTPTGTSDSIIVGYTIPIMEGAYTSACYAGQADKI